MLSTSEDRGPRLPAGYPSHRFSAARSAPDLGDTSAFLRKPLLGTQANKVVGASSPCYQPVLRTSQARLRYQITIRDLIYNHIVMYNPLMARAATTTDAFNAVAAPRRRLLLHLLAGWVHPE